MESWFTQKYPQPPSHQYITLDYYVATNVEALMLIQQMITLNF